MFVTEDEIYPLIGEEGFTRLVAAFYAQVPADDVLGPMYPAGDLAGAERRLRNFLLFRFGGSMLYLEERGHPRLRMRHAAFAVDLAARDRWMLLMDRAFVEAKLPEDAAALLRSFFDGVATSMMNS